MENLRIFSMNLGKSYIPVKRSQRRNYLTDKIKTENYDLIMLQGERIEKEIDLDQLLNFDYKAITYNERAITLSKKENYIYALNETKTNLSTALMYHNNEPLICINVNCKDDKSFYDVSDTCRDYSDVNNQEKYTESRIVAGRFPKGIDIEAFCDNYDLIDISTLVAQKYHLTNNKEMLNHLFISKNLNPDEVKKLVGMTEIAKIGEAYPIEATLTYKKVLK